MEQPISKYGESAARYLRGNITVGVSLEDSRIKVGGTLPKPNSAVSRSRITPFLEHRPDEGGYHVELNMQLSELGSLTLPANVSVSEQYMLRLGSFIARRLHSPDQVAFFDRRLAALLRDGEIKVFPFAGGLASGAPEHQRAPYLCFQFSVGNLEPDPQNRTSQLAHGIRRLNQVVRIISREGLEQFTSQEEALREVARQWSSTKLPAPDFESLQDKLTAQTGFSFLHGALTFDHLPRLVEDPGATHLRLSFQPSVDPGRITEVFHDIQSQLSGLNRFIHDQLGASTKKFRSFMEVELVEDSSGKAKPYLHFQLHSPEPSDYQLDVEQLLWLRDSLYDDFIELLRPYEEVFELDY